MARNTLIQMRRDTATNWTSTNPVLASAEFGVETNTGLFKVGDGSTTWNSLSYAGSIPALAANSILGNNTGSTGAASALSPVQVLAMLTGVATAPFSFNGQRVTNVADPSSAQDAATKNYVDAAIQGLAWKAPARFATTANLAATYSAGVLTATANAALSVDGTAVSVGDRILVKNQTATLQNGLYVVTATGSGAAPFVLTRAADMDAANEIAGAAVDVEAGTANGGTQWAVFNNGPFTVGTTAISWTQVAGVGTYSAGTGLVLSGTQFSLSTPVSAANGGTGASSLAAHAVVLAQGASAMTGASPGAAGGVFQSAGATSDPTFSGIDGGSA